ncbi:MAG TPA: hypothetical protein P5269_03120 [Syntrophales bacterium]|nr:hypothetical protein [Syntrophales bacterium]HOM07781.1 hypothetical protein [Syntrophales bacterium]HON99450.1 hypothetical protein [Syntrophales bacterium]HPQ05987.1 hypothetical protein [Syntrophales bacterium]HRS86604.1 hypothetical protein [Syntrophales bacterium]
MEFQETRVYFYSGYKAVVRPLAFDYEGRRREVEEILDRWYEGDRDAARPVVNYFKVKTEEGGVFLVRYDSSSDTWAVRPLGD